MVGCGPAAKMRRWDGVRSTNSVRLLVGLSSDYGVSPVEILSGTGVDPAALEDPDEEINGSQELSVIQNVVDRLGGVPALGLEAGHRYHLTTFGILGYAILSSATGRDALDLLLRFRQLMYTFSWVTVAERDGAVDIVFDDSAVPSGLRRFLFERDVAATQHGLELIYGAPIRARAVEARFPTPGWAAEYERTLGTAVRFDADRNSLCYAKEQLEQPSLQADLQMAKFTTAQCEALLAKRRTRKGTTGQVHRILVREPNVAPNMERVARQLGMTSRSLRRRLAEEGTSFRALSSAVRESLAEGLLFNEGLSVKGTSYHLGFSDTRGFVAAFKRWKGVTPGEWRDAMLQEQRAAGESESSS